MNDIDHQCIFRIHYRQANIDGKDLYGCEVSFSAPSAAFLSKVTCIYMERTKEALKKKVASDLFDYMQNPRLWVRNHNEMMEENDDDE